MPIRFRCPTCNRQLSTARRKAGTQVVCPRCEDAITVPDADPTTAEVSQAVEAGAAKPARVNGRPAATRPVAVAPKPGDSGPLFEREDFERLLEPAVKKASEDDAIKPGPVRVSAAPAHEEGVMISRGAIVSLAVLMVVLLAMAFVTGYLVGTS